MFFVRLPVYTWLGLLFSLLNFNLETQPTGNRRIELKPLPFPERIYHTVQTRRDMRIR